MKTVYFMIITILNGDMQPEQNEFSICVPDLIRQLQKDHTVNHFQLRQMNIRHCTGCWSCWWKTPGICSINDDMDQIFARIMASEFLIFASPIMRGFTSSLLKRMNDRLGVHFAENEEFSGEIMEKMKNPVKFNGMRLIIFRFLKIAGLVDYYWKSNLKKNGAYRQRDNKPYGN